MLFMVIETFRNQRPPAASGKDMAGALAPLL